MTKHFDLDKCKNSGYDVGLDACRSFSYGSGFGKNVIIFGADMSSSAKKRNILTIKTDLDS